MKKLTLIITSLIMIAAFTQMSFSQSSTANQTVTLQSTAIYKMTVSGNPAALTLANGVAGSDTLTAVGDSSSTYNITQNFGNTVKITAQINSAIPAGFWLTLKLASSKGTSAGAIDISNATSALSVVTAINPGADNGQKIAYIFDGRASAGTLSSTTRTVTLTLSN